MGRRQTMPTDTERREAALLPEGIDPMPGVPEVRVLDEDGREVMRGYYCCHINRQVAPLGVDSLRPEDIDHCVVYDGPADWNMTKPVNVAKITPPHRIEVVGGIDFDALLELADEMEQKADENRLTGMMSIGRARSWADRIREALEVES